MHPTRWRARSEFRSRGGDLPQHAHIESCDALQYIARNTWIFSDRATPSEDIAPQIAQQELVKPVVDGRRVDYVRIAVNFTRSRRRADTVENASCKLRRCQRERERSMRTIGIGCEKTGDDNNDRGEPGSRLLARKSDAAYA